MSAYSEFVAARPDVVELSDDQLDAVFHDVFTNVRSLAPTQAVGLPRVNTSEPDSPARRRVTLAMTAAAAAIMVIGLVVIAGRDTPPSSTSVPPTAIDDSPPSSPPTDLKTPPRLLPADMGGFQVVSAQISVVPASTDLVWIFAKPQTGGAYTDKLTVRQLTDERAWIDPDSGLADYEISILKLDGDRSAEMLYDETNSAFIAQFRDQDDRIVQLVDDDVDDADAERAILEAQTRHTAAATSFGELSVAPELTGYEAVYHGSGRPFADATTRSITLAANNALPDGPLTLVTQTGDVGVPFVQMMDDLTPIGLRDGHRGFSTTHAYPANFPQSPMVAIIWEEGPGQWATVRGVGGWSTEQLLDFAETLQEVDDQTWQTTTQAAPPTASAPTSAASGGTP